VRERGAFPRRVEGEALVGEREHEQAAVAEDPLPLAHRVDGTGHVLEHVVRDDEVERAALDGREGLAVAPDVGKARAGIHRRHLFAREEVGVEHLRAFFERKRRVQRADLQAAPAEEGSEAGAGAVATGNHIGRIAVQGGVQPLALLVTLALAATATAAPKAKSRTVTLDVKDAEAREVLQSMRKQCGIKNMVIDPDVHAGGASFYFKQVPCETAFRVVLRTYGLTSQVQVLR
jgi:hypothetical protein